MRLEFPVGFPDVDIHPDQAALGMPVPKHRTVANIFISSTS